MSNKKYIIVIVLFIVCSLLVFSFANPKGDSKISSGSNSGENTNNQGNVNDPEENDEISFEDSKRQLNAIWAEIKTLISSDYTEDSWKALDDACNLPETTKEEVIVKLEAIKKAKDELVLLDSENNQGNDDNEGNSSNSSTIINNITTPSNRPTSGNNNGGNNNGNNSSNSGSGNISENPGNGGSQNNPSIPSVDEELENLKQSLNNLKNEVNGLDKGKYTDESVGSLNNAMNLPENTKDEIRNKINKISEAKNNLILKPETIGSSSISVNIESDSATSKMNISSVQNDNVIVLQGTIVNKVDEEDVQIYSIPIKFEAPRIIDESILKNATFKISSNNYGFSTKTKSLYNDFANKNALMTENAYFVYNFNIQESITLDNAKPLNVSIDWGNGQPITYTLDFRNITIK